MDPCRLLIDTDPGVDDALAILMAHAHADVAALTIATGNVGLGQTTANALKLIEVIGADTPVYPGCPVPLVQAPDGGASEIHGRDGFGDTGYAAARRNPESEHAALAMSRLTREAPGEITLVCIAPLTNLALAVRLDPELPKRVARLVIMGGAVTGHGNYLRPATEFNAGFDPEAAAIVFGAFPSFELVDWEATLRYPLRDAELDGWFRRGDDRARFYADISRHARAANRARGRGGLMAADALAMAVALQPDVVTRAETRHLEVALAEGVTRGATVVDWDGRGGKPANARIVLEVDRARFESMVAAGLGVSG